MCRFEHGKKYSLCKEFDLMFISHFQLFCMHGVSHFLNEFIKELEFFVGIKLSSLWIW